MRALALVMIVAACTPVAHTFTCRSSAACVNRAGTQGTCEATGWCSFPDAACDSGRRYGALAGDGLGGACVTPACGNLGDACCAGDVCPGGLACVGGQCVGCVTALAVGDGFGCALKADATVACWGRNDHGQLGNGGGGDAAAAQPVVDDHGAALGDVRAIAAGAAHACARRGDGTVWCWGDDGAGQLGRAGGAVNAVPAAVALGSVTAIAAGARHTCAALGNGSTWCWGANDAGQLGSAPSAGATMPVEVVDRGGQPIDAVALAAGEAHTCVVRGDGSLWCWGADEAGELGDGATAATRLPAAAAPVGMHARAAAAGAAFSCVGRDDGGVDCVGQNDRGQCAQPGGGDVAVPAAVGLDLVTAVAAGGDAACARRAGGGLWCWGQGAAAPAAVRTGVGAIAVRDGEVCSARADGVDCAAFGDPHLACP